MKDVSPAFHRITLLRLRNSLFTPDAQAEEVRRGGWLHVFCCMTIRRCALLCGPDVWACAKATGLCTCLDAIRFG